jgi:transposase-like protein
VSHGKAKQERRSRSQTRPLYERVQARSRALARARREDRCTTGAGTGVARNQLYKWLEQLRAKGDTNAFRGPGAKTLCERSEIERLKREVEELREERDILKKAATFFAKELP